MAEWSITTLPDGRYRVLFVERRGAEPIECGVCPAHTPRELMMEWLVVESEAYDLIDDGRGTFVKLASVRE